MEDVCLPFIDPHHTEESPGAERPRGSPPLQEMPPPVFPLHSARSRPGSGHGKLSWHRTLAVAPAARPGRCWAPVLWPARRLLRSRHIRR